MIGLAFLAIVIASPDGLMGIWDRIWSGMRGRGGTGEPAVAGGSAGSQAPRKGGSTTGTCEATAEDWEASELHG